jgi:hypothetical protein
VSKYWRISEVEELGKVLVHCNPMHSRSQYAESAARRLRSMRMVQMRVNAVMSAPTTRKGVFIGRLTAPFSGRPLRP